MADDGGSGPDVLPPNLAADLARLGVAAGPDGHGWATLEAAARARGLTVHVEEVTTRATTRHRAVLARAIATDRPGLAWHQTARGNGRTEEEALARALVRWLGRPR